MQKKCNAVFEGGGVRGIGHVGAAYVIEQAGYRFENLVGSSAGAIVASLLAAGYTTEEIKQEMEALDYLKFRQEGMLSRSGTFGKVLSLYQRFGIYDADYLEHWLTGLLQKKGNTVFGDIKTHSLSAAIPYRLQVTASDVTGQRLLILPRDLQKFGIQPDSYPIAKAVRMSMSIPLFYKPFRLRDKTGTEHLIVDGGLLSNYPIWLLDEEQNTSLYPTFGFKFIEGGECQPDKAASNPNLIQYLKDLVSTALDAADKQHISKSHGDFARTIAIPITIMVNGQKKKISSTNFGITKPESEMLFHNGEQAAKAFLANWDFHQWKTTYHR